VSFSSGLDLEVALRAVEANVEFIKEVDLAEQQGTLSAFVQANTRRTGPKLAILASTRMARAS
jgi:hypothetical protein